MTSNPVCLPPSGSSCSPEVQLSAQPGSLTVLLRADHPRILEYGAFMKYLVYLAREGEPLEVRRGQGSPSGRGRQGGEEGSGVTVREGEPLKVRRGQGSPSGRGYLEGSGVTIREGGTWRGQG